MKKQGKFYLIFVFAFLSVFLFGCSDEQPLTKEYLDSLTEITTKSQLKDAMAGDEQKVFIYGKMDAVDPVGFDEIDGDFVWALRREEEMQYDGSSTHFYKRGSRYYTTHSSGGSHWKNVNEESISCKNVSMLDVEFSADKILIHDVHDASDRYEHLLKKSYINDNDRYLFYGLKSGTEGTFYCTIGKNIVPDGEFFPGKTIEETKEYLEVHN